MAYLGIDLGTSGLRALLVDDAGAAVASVTQTYETHQPQHGWSEQDPATWTTALDAAMAELRGLSAVYQDIRGIAVSGHMHGAVLLDAANRIIRPCILWNDTRAEAEAAVLDGTPNVRALSGNIVFPGFTAPKLAWLRQNEPENFARVAKVLLPAGYLNWYLTCDHVADMSDSAGTAWLDVGQRDWSETLLAASGMRHEQMPRLTEGCHAAGLLDPNRARDWGLPPGIVVAGGAGDNAAAACGIGALAEGQGFVSLGTSGVLLLARGGYQPAPATALHTFCHAVPDRWYQMGVMLSATDALNWLSRISGQSPKALTAALGDDLRLPGPEVFLPYLAGERTPHNDANIRGAFTGLGTQTSLADMTRAVLAGVAYGLRDSAEAIRAAGGRFDTLTAIGGGAASRYWLRLIATVLDTDLHVPEGAEFGAALGAARLAMIAHTGDAVETVMTPPKTREIIAPDQTVSAAFHADYARFKATYPALKQITP